MDARAVRTVEDAIKVGADLRHWWLRGSLGETIRDEIIETDFDIKDPPEFRTS